MSIHTFDFKGTWKNGIHGEGQVSVGNLETVVSVPKDMGGTGVGTNPEEMLVGAAASCYMITLAILIERAYIKLIDYKIDSSAAFNTEGGMYLEKIIHKPVVILDVNTTPEELEKVVHMTTRADELCMVTRALKGNVVIETEPTVKRG